jgi:hypothetical protein
MRTLIWILVVVSGTLVPRDAAAGQQAAGPDVRLGLGLVRQGGLFGDDDPESTSGMGLAAGVQIRGQTTRRTGLAFEVVLQPVGIRNPHFDETLHTVSLLVGPEVGRRTYVRSAAGVAIQAWSGARAESGFDLAMAMGLAIGRRQVIGRRVGLEGVARTSFSHGAFAWMLGIQVPIRVGD